MRRIASSLALTLIALTLVPSTPLANAATVGFSWSGGVLTVTGTGGNDSLTVTCSAGSVSVNGSTDFGFGLVPCASVAAITLLGAGGDDTLNTTPANPANFTSPITTTLKGGPGNDTLSASTGDDTLKGGTGNDTLTGSFGNETIGGGKGTDILKETGFAFGTGDTIMLTDTTMSGDLGSDTLSSIEAADITGTSMADVMSSAGFSGPVFFDGDAGADSITGGPGDDTLMAGNGGDTIVGGSGNDTIVPGPGDDSAQGGSGLDMLAEPTDASTTFTAITMMASTTGSGSIIMRFDTGGMRSSASASKKGVLMVPGHTVSTCTPASSTSYDNASAKPTCANFDAA